MLLELLPERLFRSLLAVFHDFPDWLAELVELDDLDGGFAVAFLITVYPVGDTLLGGRSHLQKLFAGDLMSTCFWSPACAVRATSRPPSAEAIVTDPMMDCFFMISSLVVVASLRFVPGPLPPGSACNRSNHRTMHHDEVGAHEARTLPAEL